MHKDDWLTIRGPLVSRCVASQEVWTISEEMPGRNAESAMRKPTLLLVVLSSQAES